MKWQQTVEQITPNNHLNVTVVYIDHENQTLIIGVRSLDKEQTAKVDNFLAAHQIPLDMVKLTQVDIVLTPEFPFVGLVLFISITSIIGFYRTKISK